MKNIIFLLLVSTLTFAGSLEDYTDRCLSAGGYYGNVSAKALSSGEIKLIASQGFGYNMTRQLNLDPAHTLSTLFDKDNCKARKTAAGNNVLNCFAEDLEVQFLSDHSDAVNKVKNVEKIWFSIKEALLETAEGTENSFIVSLHIRMLNEKGHPVIAETTFNFTEPLGTCTF